MTQEALPSDGEIRASHKVWRRRGGMLALLALLGGGFYLHRRLHRAPPPGRPFAQAPTLAAYLPGREEGDAGPDYLEALDTLERLGERQALEASCAPDEARHAEAFAALERGSRKARAGLAPDFGGAKALACLARILDERSRRALAEGRFPAAEETARRRLSLAEHLISSPRPEARTLGRAAAGEALLRLAGALGAQGRLPLEERLRIAKLAGELRLAAP